MSAYLLLLVCMSLGWALARCWPMPDNTAPVLTAWIMRVALPALVLVQIPRLQPDAGLLLPALAPWALALSTLAMMRWLGRRLGWTRGTVGCLILTCGLGNTSFVGLPMILALRGEPALGAAVISDQLGSFLALSTVGMLVSAVYAGTSTDPRELTRRVLSFPPFLVLPVAGLVLWIGGWPPVVGAVLQRLSETLTPVALFLVGMQFRLGDVRRHAPELLLGLGWKMVIAPALILALALLAGLQGLSSDVAVLQIAMAPMVTAGILAQQSGLAPRLANTMVSVGTLVSLLSVPLWSLALGACRT